MEQILILGSERIPPLGPPFQPLNGIAAIFRPAYYGRCISRFLGTVVYMHRSLSRPSIFILYVLLSVLDGGISDPV